MINYFYNMKVNNFDLALIGFFANFILYVGLSSLLHWLFGIGLTGEIMWGFAFGLGFGSFILHIVFAKMNNEKIFGEKII